MARNRVIHNVQDVFVGSTPDEADNFITGIAGHQILKRVTRAQGFNYTINLDKNDSLTLGKGAPFSRENNKPPTVNLSLSYLLNGVDNERRTGLNVGSIEDQVDQWSPLSWEESQVDVVGPDTHADGTAQTVRINAKANSAYHKVYKDVSTITSGKRYRITAKIYIPSGGTNIRGFQFRHGNGTSGPIIHPTLDSWYDFSYDFVAVGTDYDGWIEFWMANSSPVDAVTTFQWVGNTSSDKFWIDKVTVSEIKSLVHDMVLTSAKDKRNIYLAVNEEEANIHKGNTLQNSAALTEANLGDPSATGYSTVVFQNCYLDSYALSVRPAELPSVDLSYSADNMIGYASGSGINIPDLDPQKGEVKDASTSVYTSDFSADEDGWSATSATMNYYSYGPAGSAGVPNVGMFYGNDAEATHFISKTILTVGKKYRVTGRYHAVPSSSSSELGGIYIYDGWGHELKMLSTVDAWVDFDLEFVAESGSGSGSLNFYARNKSGGPTLTMAAGDYIYVEGIVVTEVKEFIIPNQYVDDSSYTSNYTKNYSHANATISRVGVSGVDEFLNDHLTSCTLNTSIDREAIGYVGHKLYSDRKPKVPVQTSLSFDTIVKNNISGSFLDNMKEGEDYNIVIDLKSTDDSTLAKYTLSGAKLDSLSYNSQVLTKRSASLNFSNYMDLENSSEGLFLEGKVTSASSDGDLIYPQF